MGVIIFENNLTKIISNRYSKCRKSEILSAKSFYWWLHTTIPKAYKQEYDKIYLYKYNIVLQPILDIFKLKLVKINCLHECNQINGSELSEINQSTHWNYIKIAFWHIYTLSKKGSFEMFFDMIFDIKGILPKKLFKNTYYGTCDWKFNVNRREGAAFNFK